MNRILFMLKSKAFIQILTVLIIYLIIMVLFVIPPTTQNTENFYVSSFNTKDFNQLYFPFLFTFITFFALIFTFSKTEYLKIKSIRMYKTEFSFTAFTVPIIIYIIILFGDYNRYIEYLQIFLIVQLIITFMQTIVAFYQYNNHHYVSKNLRKLSKENCWNVITSINVEDDNHKKNLADFISKMDSKFILSLDNANNFNIDQRIQEILIYQIAEIMPVSDVEISLVNNSIETKKYEIISNTLNEAISKREQQVFYNICEAISNTIKPRYGMQEYIDSNFDIDTIFEKVDYKRNLTFVSKVLLDYIQKRSKELNGDIFQQIFLGKIYDVCMAEIGGKEMFLSLILNNYAKNSKYYINDDNKMNCIDKEDVGFINYGNTYVGLYDGSDVDIENIKKNISKKIEEFQLLKAHNLSNTDLLYQIFIRNINNKKFYSLQFINIESDDTERPILYNSLSNKFIEHIILRNNELIIEIDKVNKLISEPYHNFLDPKDLTGGIISGKIVHGYFFNDKYYEKNGSLSSIRAKRKIYVEEAIKKYEAFINELIALLETDNINIDKYFQQQAERATMILNNASKVINDSISVYVNIDRNLYGLGKAIGNAIPLCNSSSSISLIMLEDLINRDKEFSYPTNYVGLDNYLRVSKILKYSDREQLLNPQYIKHYDIKEYLNFVNQHDFRIYYNIFTISNDFFSGINKISGWKEKSYTSPFLTYKYYSYIDDSNMIKLINLYMQKYPESEHDIFKLLEDSIHLKYIIPLLKATDNNKSNFIKLYDIFKRFSNMNIQK